MHASYIYKKDVGYEKIRKTKKSIREIKLQKFI